MTRLSTNICVRCGKERIDLKSWTEEVESFFGKGLIKHTETVCPDKECQKIVNEKIESARQKSLEMKAERDERLKNAEMHRGRRFSKS